MAQVNQPCPGICEVRMKYQADGEPLENVYHVSNGTQGHWTDLDLQSLGDVVENWHASQVIPILPVGVTLQEIILTDLTDLAGLKRSKPVLANAQGTHASPMMPLNVTKAIELFTGNRGRGVNGHVYWPALAEDQVAGDQVASAVMDAIMLAFETLVTDINTDLPGKILVVLSRYLGGAKRATGIGRTVTAFEFPNTILNTQKNRLPLHKKHRRRTP